MAISDRSSCEIIEAYLANEYLRDIELAMNEEAEENLLHLERETIEVHPLDRDLAMDQVGQMVVIGGCERKIRVGLTSALRFHRLCIR